MDLVAAGISSNLKGTPLEVGKGIIRRGGKDVALMGYGSMVNPCLEAADMLQKVGCCVCLILRGVSTCRCICCAFKLALQCWHLCLAPPRQCRLAGPGLSLCPISREAPVACVWPSGCGWQVLKESPCRGRLLPALRMILTPNPAP